MNDAVHSLGDMEANVAAEVNAVSGATGGFDEIAHSVTNDGGVEVADMENFEGVGVGIFSNDDLVFVDTGETEILVGVDVI